MEAIIRKWGNSPALRLPSAVMKSAALEVEQHVIITATKGRIVIEPLAQPEVEGEQEGAAGEPRSLNTSWKICLRP